MWMRRLGKRTERALTSYIVLFSQVTFLKYLGRFLEAEDENWMAVVFNLRRAR